MIGLKCLKEFVLTKPMVRRWCIIAITDTFLTQILDFNRKCAMVVMI